MKYFSSHLYMGEVMRTYLYMLFAAAFMGGASYGFAEITTGTMPAQSGEDVSTITPEAMDMPRIKPIPKPTVYIEDPAYRRIIILTVPVVTTKDHHIGYRPSVSITVTNGRTNN